MRVFISYSHVDEKYVQEIIEFFKKNSISYFLDKKDIEWGDNIKNTINSILDKHITHELVVISPGSIKSQWVAYEIGYATAKGLTILPYLIHPSIDVPTFISELNYLDDIEKVKKYFENYLINSGQYIKIINNNGEAEYVHYLISFEIKKTKQQYLVYDKNEIEGNSEITSYVCRLNRAGENMKMEKITDQDEWEEVRSIIQYLATPEGQDHPNTVDKDIFKNITFKDSQGYDLI